MGLIETGTVFAGHRIERVIGRGGMGVVYLATHLALERPVALKVIDPSLAHDPGFRARFQREARLAAAIDHPNVVPVHHAGEDAGLLYLSMRYIDGPDLRAVLRAGALPPARAVAVVSALGAALDAAHERGMIHRDVKPANVLIDGDRVLLTDFGVTRLAGSGTTVTGTGQFVGTADYMAPEQALGHDLDRRADVYSLACLLFETLTARVPYERESPLATLAAHMNEPPPRPSTAAAHLAPFDAVVGRGMAKDRDDRYPSAPDLAAAARDAAASMPAADTAVVPPPAPSTRGGAAPGDAPPTRATPAPPPPSPGHVAPGTAPAPAPRRSRRRLLAATGVVAALAVAAVLAVVATRSDESPGPRADAGAGAGAGAGPEAAPEVGPACAAPIPIGPNPFHVVVGHGSVWTSAGDEGLVRRIDPATCEVVGEIAVGSLPGAMAIGRTGVWVARDGDGGVGRIDPATGAFTMAAPGVVERPRGLVARGGTVWASGLASGTLARVDAVNGRPLGEPIAIGREPRGLAYSRGALWVSLEGEDRVAVVSAADGRVLDPTGGPIAVGNAPRGLGGSADAVWSASWLQGTLVRVDARTAAVGPPIPVGANPGVVAVGEGSVWVTNNADDTVSRVDPGSQAVTETIPVEPGPRGIAVGAGAVWVVSRGADGGEGTLRRIDPAR